MEENGKIKNKFIIFSIHICDTSTKQKSSQSSSNRVSTHRNLPKLDKLYMQVLGSS